MPWSVRAVPLPDGDRPSDLWVDAGGCLATRPVPGAEPLPGRYVVPGLVDAHAHPAVAPGPAARSGAQTLDELAGWAAAGVPLEGDRGFPPPRRREAGRDAVPDVLAGGRRGDDRRFLGEPFGQPGRPATLVTYRDDPREDLAVLSAPAAVLIDGVRVR